MAIKKLQNSFTTPEQSKRLLELGVPADSADCYYHHYFTNDPTPLLRVLQLQWGETIGAIRGKSGQKIEPCWSVGRLIEICKLCLPLKDYENTIEEYMYCKDFTKACISMIEFNMPIIDFSKLED